MKTTNNKAKMKILNAVKLTAILAFGSSTLLGSGCSKQYVSDIKAHATNVWDNAGFKIVGYEGYQWSLPGETWGGKVWYIVQRKDSGSTLYHGFISKWGDEYHIYNLRAIDAIKGN